MISIKFDLNKKKDTEETIRSGWERRDTSACSECSAPKKKPRWHTKAGSKFSEI